VEIPRYTAYVPVYNQASTLREALDALRVQTLAPSEILVIDDASTDNSNEIATTAGVTILRQPSNLGRGAARARALESAKNEFVLCCDATNRLAADFAEKALDHLKDNPRLAAVHGRVTQHAARTLAERWRGRHLYLGATGPVQTNVFHSTGAAMLRRSSVLEVGNYRADLPSQEDSELGVRLNAAGWGVWFDPSMVADSMASNTLVQVFSRYARWYEPRGRGWKFGDYPNNLRNTLRVQLPRDIAARDLPAAFATLLLPHYLLYRSLHGPLAPAPQLKPRVLFLNLYAEQWLDACWTAKNGSRAHLWGADGLRKAGFTVENVKTRDEGLLERLARWADRVTKLRFGDLAADLAVLRQARHGDIIYVASGRLLFAPLAVRLGILRVKIVTWLYRPPEPFSWRKLRGFDTLPVVYRGYAGWFGLTPRVSGWLRDNYPAARTRRIVWASDTEFFNPSRDDGTYFAATGVTRRDYQLLLDVAHDVDFPFIILGPDSYKNSAPKNVTWISRTPGEPHATVENEKLRDIYHGARAILIPLVPDPEDPSGLTNLLDAMACGRAVVMTRTGALDLTPAALGVGYDIPPSDNATWIHALRTLAAQPATARAFGEKAAQLSRDYFNLDRLASDVANYFLDLTENKPEPREEIPPPPRQGKTADILIPS